MDTLGTTFRTQDQLPLSTLSECLCKIVSILQEIQPTAVLSRFDDWWEHDGQRFSRGQIDFHQLFGIIATGRSVFEATPQDEYVCVAVVPSSGAWYLRFRAEWNEREDTLVGRFDLTTVDELADHLRPALSASLPCRLAEERADAHFKRIAG